MANQPRSETAFDALSYAWGPTYVDCSHLTQAIVCDGRILRVTENLHAALKRLREIESARLGGLRWPIQTSAKWIDALCIDQNNMEERSRQVAQMSTIYGQAQTVTIWLGDTGKDWTSDFQAESLRFVERWAAEERQGHLPIRHRTIGTGLRQDLESLLQRPWFKRRWIIQEVASARKECGFLLGTTECGQNALHQAFKAHHMLLDAGPMLAHLSTFSLLQTLYFYDESQCSNPHDRIYALRSLAVDGCRVVVDYERTVRQTYFHAALAVGCGVSVEPRHKTKLDAVEFDKPRVIALELLRMLALATCKTSSLAAWRGLPSESWIPPFESWLPD